MKYSIKKRLSIIHKLYIWKKYGNKTKYHLEGPNISVGKYTYGIPNLLVYDNNVKLHIGSFCSIAKDVTILLGGNHCLTHISTFPFGVEATPLCKGKDINADSKSSYIYIGNDVWIGRGATIVSDITIGDGAIIGAGCMVTKDVPPYAIVIGNPCRLLRYRFDKVTIDKLLKIKWWEWDDKKIVENIDYFDSSDIECFIRKFEIQ